MAKATKEKLLSNYENKIKRLSQDKEYCKMVWDERIERNLKAQQEFYDGKKEGIIEGKKEGLELGKVNAQKEFVINFANNGVSHEIISKSTGLSIREVEEIIKTIN